MKTIQLIIKGKVQGVFFRATAKDIADALGVKGLVRNLQDRNVEIRATATEEALQKYIDWCKQGPPKAKVEDVTVEELVPEEFNNFKIIR